MLADAPEPLGDDREHRDRDPRLVLEQVPEVLAADRDAAHVGRRADARGARRIGNEQRELADELAGPDLDLVPVPRFDDGGARLDHEQARAGSPGRTSVWPAGTAISTATARTRSSPASSRPANSGSSVSAIIRASYHAGASSTFPSLFAMCSTRTTILSPRRKRRPLRRPTSAVPIGFSSKNSP